MACALLDPMGEGNENLITTDAAPDDDGNDYQSSAGRSNRSRGAASGSRGGAPKKRARKGEVTMLSTSFTCWRKVPEPRLQAATYVIMYYTLPFAIPCPNHNQSY